MIKPANRVSSIEEYFFSRKLKEVARLNAGGADIVSLGIGGPDRMPAAEVVETLCEEARKPGSHSYQPFAGLPELRRAFADWYSRWYGVELDPDTEIQPLIGSKEAVIHLCLTFLNPGDGVLVPNPGYPTYTSAARLAEARVIPYDLTEQTGWQPDFSQLEALADGGVKLMFLNYPHMPTGAQPRPDVMERLVAFARSRDIVIVHDNPYSFILNDEPRSILSVPGAREVCIELNSLSKSHNMAGWRVAMLAAKPEFLQWFVKVKSNVDSGMFRPVMVAAVKALQAPREWYADLNAEYARRRALAEQIAAALGCTFDASQRGLFLWAKMPEGDTRSAMEFADDILYSRRVFITPGSIFGSNGEGYIRISLCADLPALQKALSRLHP